MMKNFGYCPRCLKYGDLLIKLTDHGYCLNCRSDFSTHATIQITPDPQAPKHDDPRRKNES